MDFKIVIFAAAVMTLAACGGGAPQGDEKSENIIGAPLQSVSALRSEEGEEKKQVVLFDPTVKRIQHFDLTSMTHIKSYGVLNPDEKHYLLYQDSGSYIVDISLKGLSIFSKDNSAVHNPLELQGVPKSAAFKSDLGILIVYDDLMSVGILKIDADGKILKKYPGGGLFATETTISAGDLLADGNLILTGSDNSFAVVDVEKTLDLQDWQIIRRFSTALTGISWVSPVRGVTDQILVKAKDTVALVNIVTGAIIQSVDVSSYYIEKYSKVVDPHILFKSAYNSGNGYQESELILMYVDQGQIKTRKLFKQKNKVMTSNLDLKTNDWTYTESQFQTYYSVFNNLNEVKEDRTLKRYRFSDLFALRSKAVPNKAELFLAPSFMFALYPSKLGYAVRYDLNTEASTELKMFNMKDM